VTPPSSAPVESSPPWDLALSQARQAVGLSEPNPRVGCVITDDRGQVLGQGHTQQAGGPHAEVMALRDAAAGGAAVQGATAWVTLEPCAHHGRTPPCCDALIAAGIAKVHAALRDPFPQVAGQGLQRLRDAGVRVFEDAPPAVREAAFDINIGFFSRVLRERPWLRMKAALSIDGRTALPDGSSQWITGPEARQDGHRWRARAGAVLTGIGTVRDDDPRLDVRGVEVVLQPVRIVVDSRLELSLSARILEPPGRVWVACAEELAASARADQLRERGCEILALPAPGGKTDLAALLTQLALRGINELHVEAGHRLNGSWLKAGLVDEWLLYMAPRVLGEGAGPATVGSLPSLQASFNFRWLEASAVGGDLRLRAVSEPSLAPLREALNLHPMSAASLSPT
jgi:diaminohydroxyphosphoribosylaminopyrimidine deaminase / 5-amino-6-(5-phosphoribosylamino)uracil reductase